MNETSQSAKDTSRISITAHHTSYTWYANSLSHKAFATLRGRWLYKGTIPLNWIGKTVLGISDIETSLLQRHLIIDHLLENAIRDMGVGQVLELACGLSPRGFRFMERYDGRGLTYIEADLPGMARKKKSMLRNAGLLRNNHQVVVCNILSENKGISLRNVADKYLDPEVPTAIITEGLINYFNRSTMECFWQQIADVLRSHAGGVYLSDNLSHQLGHLLYPVLRIGSRVVGLAVRGKMHMHFHSDEDAEEAFQTCSFNEVSIHSPEAYFGRLKIPRSRWPGFVKVIEARV